MVLNLHPTSDSAAQPAPPGADVFVGCSRVCVLIGSIGLGLSALAGYSAYRSLHERQETVAAAVVHHIGAAHCTAISQAIQTLNLARTHNHLPADHDLPLLQGQPSGVGIVNLDDGQLERFHSAAIPWQQARAVVKELPLAQLRSTPRSLPSHPPTGEPSSCDPSLLAGSQTIEAYTVPSRPNELVLVSRSQGTARAGVVMIDLTSHAIALSGHNQAIATEQAHHGSGDLLASLQIDHSLSPHQAEGRSAANTHAAAEPEPSQMVTIPFANTLLTIHASPDHRALVRDAIKPTALVVAIGLLATSAVILISRHSEVKLRRLNQALHRESRTDRLTQASNRRAWDELLSRQEGLRARHGRQHGILVLDLDGFKRINDAEGHQAGDEILIRTAALIRQELRETDLLARLGGDEFAVFVEDAGAEGLERLRRRLSRCLSEANIQASIGTAVSRPDMSLEETWVDADHHMYRIKLPTAWATSSGSDASSVQSTPST